MLYNLLINKTENNSNLKISAEFNTDTSETIGLLSTTLVGYGTTNPIVTVDDRGALRCGYGSGVVFSDPTNSNSLIGTRPFCLEWEMRFVNLSAFKHDIGVKFSDSTGKILLDIWNREQSGNRLIVIGPNNTESSPLMIENVTPGSNIWVKYVIQRTNEKHMQLYVNDNLNFTAMNFTNDLSSSKLTFGTTKNVNYFNGYIRNVKFWDGESIY